MEARVEKPHRIAGYCRISVDVEADRDNTGIEDQKDIISDYVQRYFPENELTFFVGRDRSGYTFEQGVTYTVEYTLAEGRSLAFWVADTDVHGLFWKAGEYRILAEAVTFGKFYGVKTN